VLDLMLPGLDGLELCKKLRADPATALTPVIMLTAKAEESDKIVGLELGADDYLTKPFSPRELVARVKAILRRSLHRPNATAKRLRHLDLDIDFEKRKVTVVGKEIGLTVYEYKILEALAHAPGIALSREQLIQKIYAYEDVSVVDRVIDVHVGNLRAKIEQDPSHPQYIITVRGVGYKFAEIEGA
jgi:DNA-binding response OmpR family regulator